MPLPATDNFNRADSADIGTNWTPQNGSFELVSNTILPNGAGAGTENAERWNADTFGNDQYAECIIAGVSANAGSGVAARINTAAAVSWYGYYGWGAASFLFKMVTGSWTQLGSNATGFSNSDVARIETEGTTITGYINAASEIAQTDSALASGAAGVTGWGDNAGTTLDDWEGGDLGGGATTIINQIQGSNLGADLYNGALI